MHGKRVKLSTNWRRTLGTLFLLSSALLAMPHPAQASGTISPDLNAQQLAAVEQAPEAERVRLMIMLAKSGRHELASQLLQRFPLSGPYAENRTLFIEGLILKGRKNYTGAVKKFRTALASDPKLTLVRSELAETLIILDQDDSAKHHLELLAADAPDEQAASGIRSFIEQIDERRPYKFDSYVSVAPSTNVNNGSSHKTVYSPIFGTDMVINDDSKKTSGLGAAVGVSAGYSKRMGNDISFVAGASGEARVYTDKDYNSYAMSQSMEFRYLLDSGYLGLGAVASQQLKNDDLGFSYLSYGPRISLSKNLSPRNRLAVSAVHEWRNSLENDASDGTALLVNASIAHAFDSSFTGTLLGGFDRVKTGRDTSSYRTWSGGLGIYKELPKGITVELNGQARLSEFDGVYALAGKQRKDTRLISDLTLTKRDFEIFGLAPSLNYTYTRNFSNIELFDYDSHAIDFRLTRSF